MSIILSEFIQHVIAKIWIIDRKFCFDFSKRVASLRLFLPLAKEAFDNVTLGIDLGMLDTHDLLLAISNSGESRELTDILLFAKKHSLPIIAVTKNLRSTLGQLADIGLELPDSPEACPLDRAPSTSTTATLALGDALAMTLMKMRNFQEDDFVNYHPGGKLGATLLSVENLLRRQGG